MSLANFRTGWTTQEWGEFAVIGLISFVALPPVLILAGSSEPLRTWFAGKGLGTAVLWVTGLVILLYTIETKRMRQQLALQTKALQLDRVIEVVRAVRRFLDRVERDAALHSFDPLYELVTKTRDSGVLFDPDTAAYIAEMQQRGLRLHFICKKLREDVLGTDERTRLVNEETEVAWMQAQQAALNEKFRRYLSLSE